MTKKNVAPKISDEELNSLLGIDKQYSTAGSDTESTLQTDDDERKIIPEPTEESLPDPAKVVSTASVVNAASMPIDPEIPSIPSVSTAPGTPEPPSTLTAPTPLELRRPCTKQRKASFEEYRETFLRAPKISDRQPVFLSRTTRDRIDEICLSA